MPKDDRNTWYAKLARMVNSIYPIAENRRGECIDCGECCKLPITCPFLGYRSNGKSYCAIHQLRTPNCRKYPRTETENITQLICGFWFEQIEKPNKEIVNSIKSSLTELINNTELKKSLWNNFLFSMPSTIILKEDPDNESHYLETGLHIGWYMPEKNHSFGYGLNRNYEVKDLKKNRFLMQRPVSTDEAADYLFRRKVNPSELEITSKNIIKKYAAHLPS